MVKPIQGFEAGDGSVHPTWDAAAIHDAKLELKKLNQFKPETITAIIQHAHGITKALEALVKGPNGQGKPASFGLARKPFDGDPR